MKGWFDAFRTDGGPTLYSYSNRTPVTGDVPTITLYVLFFTLFIAFVIIFPGVRKERFTTFTTVTLSLFVGSVILVTQYGSSWHVTDSSIMSYYRAFSKEKLNAEIGIHVGLMHFNVTLQGLTSSVNFSENDTFREDIDFNERFHWVGATQIQNEFREALVKGLPYPILTVVEYFSLDEEGFSWGRQYRQAGYYGSLLLWASFASWLLMNLLIVVVPRYGAYQMIITGTLMWTTNLIYYLLVPHKMMMIRFEDDILRFKFGWCFWLVLIAGALCLSVGGIVAIIDIMFPNKFSTILEVDYGTPFDRHVIIEDSHDTKTKKGGKRSLEEPEALGFGRKILRTLSKREKSDETDLRHNGLENRGFELDCPKSPWRYPHMMYRPDGTPVRPALQNAFSRNPALARLAAPTPTKSPKSVSFRRQSRLEQTFAPEPLRLKRSVSQDSAASSISSGITPNHNDDLPSFQNQFKAVQRSDSAQSGSSMSSLGLGFLTRTISRRETHPNPTSPLEHQPLSVSKSTSSVGSGMSPSDVSKTPLSRIHYKTKHMGITHLPRASFERKFSSEEENDPAGRRHSNGSDNSRRSSSGFSSGGRDISINPGSATEVSNYRKSSSESNGNSENSFKQVLTAW